MQLVMCGLGTFATAVLMIVPGKHCKRFRELKRDVESITLRKGRLTWNLVRKLNDNQSNVAFHRHAETCKVRLESVFADCDKTLALPENLLQTSSVFWV